MPVWPQKGIQSGHPNMSQTRYMPECGRQPLSTSVLHAQDDERVRPQTARRILRGIGIVFSKVHWLVSNVRPNERVSLTRHFLTGTSNLLGLFGDPAALICLARRR